MHKSFITGIAAFSLVVVAFMPAGADPGGLPLTPGAVAEPVESPLAPAALVSVVPGAGTPELPPEMARVEKEAREGGGIESAMRAHLDRVAAANRGDATYDSDVRISGHSASTWEDAASLADAEETSLAQALTDVVGGGAGVTMQDILEEHQNGLVRWTAFL